MKLLVSVAITLMLMGCTATVPELSAETPAPMTIVVDKNGLINLEKTLPQVKLSKMGEKELFEYVTTLNWRMFRHYSTIRIVNQYARTRGWDSPDATPICRYAVIPDLPDIKEFSTDTVTDGQDLTEMLMVYIYDIQSEADITRAVFEEQVKQMQFFCIY